MEAIGKPATITHLIRGIQYHKQTKSQKRLKEMTPFTILLLDRVPLNEQSQDSLIHSLIEKRQSLGQMRSYYKCYRRSSNEKSRKLSKKKLNWCPRLSIPRKKSRAAQILIAKLDPGLQS